MSNELAAFFLNDFNQLNYVKTSFSQLKISSLQIKYRYCTSLVPIFVMSQNNFRAKLTKHVKKRTNSEIITKVNNKPPYTFNQIVTCFLCLLISLLIC